MKILNTLKPESVFGFFEEISAIPRGSGKTEKIRNYCESFAQARGLDYICDKGGNIVIFKPACGGCQSREPVILQGHLDMVCEKTGDCSINMETDGLRLAVDGDFVYAEGTTLGGDDGIAVAMCLALLDDKSAYHPPLEVVFTADEEVGMLGASAFDASCLKGKRMINIDSEAEGTLWVSCAGGVRADISYPAEYEKNSLPAFEIIMSGFHGGHSGTEIHKGYVNADKAMGELLKLLREKNDFRISEISGGLMDNAIPRDSRCVIVSASESVKQAVESICENLRADFSADPQAKITVSRVEAPEKAMSEKSSAELTDLLCELPSGVIAMSKEIDGLVETSLNLGTLSSDREDVKFGFSVRSGKDKERGKLVERISKISDKYSCGFSLYGEYPAWEYKEISPLRDKITAAYKELFGRDMTVAAIHAGLECGIFCGKINGLDCVSLGPDIFDIHTPSEKLSISSTERMWQCLLRVLETL